MFSFKFNHSHPLNIIYDEYHFPIVLNADSNGVYAIAQEIQDEVPLHPIIRQPSIYSKASSTISLSSHSKIYGTITPGMHLYTQDWGTFYIRRYAGFKNHNIIRINAVQPNGQEAELDIPVNWVNLSCAWTRKRWSCLLKRKRYIKEEVSKDVTGSKATVTSSSITIAFPNGDSTLDRSTSHISNLI
jgi:hypothetical protein